MYLKLSLDLVHTVRPCEDMENVKVTPTKVYKRDISNPTCRLCGKLTETKRMTNIFSQTGKAKVLGTNIATTCRVFVESTDRLPRSVCRNCVKFIKSMVSFREKCQNSEQQFNKGTSTERCVELSPSTAVPPKRNATIDSRRKLPFAMSACCRK